MSTAASASAIADKPDAKSIALAKIEAYVSLHAEHPAQQELIRKGKRKFEQELYPAYEKDLAKHEEDSKVSWDRWKKRREESTKARRDKYIAEKNPDQKLLENWDKCAVADTRLELTRRKNKKAPMEPTVPLQLVSDETLAKEKETHPLRNDRILGMLDAQVRDLTKEAVIPDYPKFDEKEKAAIITWAKIANERIESAASLAENEEIRGFNEALDDELLTATGSDIGVNYGVGGVDADGFSPDSPSYSPRSPKPEEDDE